MMDLSDGEKILIICLLVLTQFTNVTEKISYSYYGRRIVSRMIHQSATFLTTLNDL